VTTDPASATAAAGIAPPPVTDPSTREEIVRDLGAVREWGAAYWRSLPDDAFFAPIAEGWSPADHVRHLIKSNRPVAWALGLPKLVLLARFGFTRRGSRSYLALRATYHEALRGGLRAGRYTPTPLSPEQRSAEERESTLARWAESVDAVAAGAQRWSPGSLDRLRMPHPGLGPLTVREMLFFTLYHNTHHVLGVAGQLRC
jgi:hypothetical protein